MIGYYGRIMMKRFARVFFIACLPLVFSSCFFVPFQVIEPGFKPKGKTLAVVSGLNHDTNYFIAQSMTQSLKKQSKFKVMPQKKIAKAWRNYPVNIKGPYNSAYFDIDINYSNTDIKKLREIQKKLGVDYLYVMWAPTGSTINNSVNEINIIAQLYEFPGGKEVANGRFNSVSYSNSSCLVAKKPTAEEDAEGIRRTTDMVAKLMAEKTGMLK